MALNLSMYTASKMCLSNKSVAPLFLSPSQQILGESAIVFIAWWCKYSGVDRIQQGTAWAHSICENFCAKCESNLVGQGECYPRQF